MFRSCGNLGYTLNFPFWQLYISCFIKKIYSLNNIPAPIFRVFSTILSVASSSPWFIIQTISMQLQFNINLHPEISLKFQQIKKRIFIVHNGSPPPSSSSSVCVRLETPFVAFGILPGLLFTFVPRSHFHICLHPIHICARAPAGGQKRRQMSRCPRSCCSRRFPYLSNKIHINVINVTKKHIKQINQWN